MRTLKYERAHITDYDTFAEVRISVQHFIELLQPERLHSAIGYLPPLSFEAALQHLYGLNFLCHFRGALHIHNWCWVLIFSKSRVRGFQSLCNSIKFESLSGWEGGLPPLDFHNTRFEFSHVFTAPGSVLRGGYNSLHSITAVIWYSKRLLLCKHSPSTPKLLVY